MFIRSKLPLNILNTYFRRPCDWGNFLFHSQEMDCKLVAAQQIQQNEMGAKKRLRPAWASAQSDQFRCALNRLLRALCFFMRTAKTDQIGQMPRLIWVFAERHRSFCWFCHAAAQITFNSQSSLTAILLGLRSWKIIGRNVKVQIREIKQNNLTRTDSDDQQNRFVLLLMLKLNTQSKIIQTFY